MSLYMGDREAIARCEARALALPADAAEACEWCEEPLDDCLNGRGCARCAECNGRKGECPEDCGAGHVDGCAFPAEPCDCARLVKAWQQAAADRAADQDFQLHREGA